jgi:hypothetical protein
MTAAVVAGWNLRRAGALSMCSTQSNTGREDAMAFEDVQAEIGLLLTQMQNEPEDKHELYLQILEKLNELRAYGMPVPKDLEDLEAALEAEFSSEAGDAA